MLLLRLLIHNLDVSAMVNELEALNFGDTAVSLSTSF